MRKALAICIVLASVAAMAWAGPPAGASPPAIPSLAGWAALQPGQYTPGGSEIPFSGTPYFQKYHPEYFTDGGAGSRSAPAAAMSPVLRASGDHSALYVDSGASPQPSDDACQALSGQFDTVIWPVDTSVFGSPGSSSIEIYLYSIDGPGGVGGYYQGGNAIYGDSSDISWMPQILAHEFQHLIHNSKDSNEDLWVNEGCADLAIQLGFGASASSTSLGSHISAFEANPDNDLTVFDNQLYDYGSAYSFLSYFHEHFGGNDTMRALVADAANGISGFNDRLAGTGRDFTSVFRSWTMANYMDNVAIPGDFGYSNLSIEVQAVQVQGYPYSIGASVNRWAADYYAFAAGGPALEIWFDGQDTAQLEVWLGKEGIGEVPSSVEKMTLDSARDGNITVPGLGTDYSEVALVVSATTSGGSYTLAVDKADLSAPVTALDMDPAIPQTSDGWFTRTPKLSLSSNEPGATIYYRWDDGADSVYTGPLPAIEGDHVFRFHSQNRAGATEAEKSVPVRVDTTPPVTSLSVAPPDGQDGWYVSSPAILLSSEPGAAVYYGWAGQAGSEYLGPLRPPEGLSTLAYRSIDSHGIAEAVRTASFRVDTTVPVSSIHTDPAGPDGPNGWFLRAPVISVDTEPGGGLFYSWDGGPDTGYTVPFTAPEGRHVLSWHAEDAANNREMDRTLEFNVDSIAPSASASLFPGSPDGENGYFRTNVTVTIQTDPDATVVYRWGGGAWRNYTGPFQAPEGTSTLYYYSIDAAGNRAQIQSLDLSVDAVPPVTTISMEPDAGGAWTAAAPAVALSTEKSAATFWYIDGDQAVPYTGQVRLPAGRHALSYYSVDAAGNAEAPRSKYYALDLSNPSGVLRAESQAGLPGKAFRFDASGSADADSGVQAYLFVFGDGTDSGWVTAPALTRAFARAGRYTVSLTVRDGSGRQSAPVTVSIAVSGTAGSQGSSGPVTAGPGGPGPFLPYIGLLAALSAAVAAVALRRRKRPAAPAGGDVVAWD